MRPVCTVCGLHLKAHWRRVKIQRAIQQPCGTEVHHLVHPSHQMQCCNSKGWRCVKCGKKGTMNHLIFKHSWQQICQRQGRRRRRQLWGYGFILDVLHWGKKIELGCFNHCHGAKLHHIPPAHKCTAKLNDPHSLPSLVAIAHDDPPWRNKSLRIFFATKTKTVFISP